MKINISLNKKKHQLNKNNKKYHKKNRKKFINWMTNGHKSQNNKNNLIFNNINVLMDFNEIFTSN